MALFTVPGNRARMRRMATPSASRRDFLKTLGTALATTAAGPTILGAADKAGAKRPVIGAGEFTYEVYHDWGALPAGLSTAIRTASAKTRRATSTSTTP